MREALEYVMQWSENCISEEGADNVDDMVAVVKAALSEPPRQCDMGTADEQARRYRLFCENHSGWDGQKRFGCLNCPFIDVDECEFAWAQTPYSEKEED